ncbi:MAG: hypothetical protein LBH71_04240 [Oscillospiraceae bacterium]|nr:hypothetical protein [Oscillospiraceae bacterium]
MASEMINQVIAAEKAAAEKETAVKERAAGIIKSAQDEAKSHIEAEKNNAARKSEQIIAQAQKSSDDIFESAKAKAKTQSQSLRADAQAKLSEAVSAVVNYIIPQ